MTRKEAFEKIKALLLGEDKKFNQAKLIDGTIVQWEGDLVEGVAVMVVEEDGNMLPAPDGTHEVEDGTLVTTLGGLVTEIATKEAAETEEETEEKMASEFEAAFANHVAEFTKLLDRVASLEAKLTEYENKFNAVNEVVNNSTQSVESKFSEIKTLIDEIAAQPAGEPIKPTSGKFKIEPKKVGKSAIEIYLESRKK